MIWYVRLDFWSIPVQNYWNYESFRHFGRTIVREILIYTEEHNKNTWAYMHASSGTQTHNLSVWAIPDHTPPRTRFLPSFWNKMIYFVCVFRG